VSNQQPAPGVEIPPAYVIDALRQELANARDENSIMQIKINYQNEVIAAMQNALNLPSEEHAHDHDHDIESEISKIVDAEEMSDTPAE
jgi:hypothetical protein